MKIITYTWQLSAVFTVKKYRTSREEISYDILPTKEKRSKKKIKFKNKRLHLTPKILRWRSQLFASGRKFNETELYEVQKDGPQWNWIIRGTKDGLLCFYSLLNTGGVMPDSFSLLCDVTVITSVNEIKMFMHILII